MDQALLSTKLHIPSHRPGLVPRPRLTERLDNGLGGKLTLVSAPAGFGKTTMISEWVQNCGHQVAWLSLDKDDNDLSRFLTYLISALQRIDGEIGIDLQAALEESLSPQFEILLTRLISEIDAISEQSILVLDDYHLINSKTIHDALNFLVEYLPPFMHLVVAGRADPPLPISRLRVQGEVNEIRTPDLRFTKLEIAAFLNDLMGFELTSEDIDRLERRTEGWIASLQLAALSMQGRTDRQAFIADFSGSHRYIIDYLVDEVMERQSEDVQNFLLRTSILERFCASLCEVVVDADGIKGKSILDYLDWANLFLISLDDHRGWYRYHHLFADFLNQRLQDEEPQLIPALHRRASQWFENEELVDEAIQHALTASDMEGAIRLIKQIAPSLITNRNHNVLLKLVDQLPYELLQNYPMLCIWYAWALLFLGQLESVEPILKTAEAAKRNAPTLPITGFATTVRAYLANQKGEFNGAIELSEQALNLMVSDSTDQVTAIIRGAAVIWLGVNHRLLGNLEKASQYFVESASLNQKAGSNYAALSSYQQLAELAIIRGQLHQAENHYHQAILMAQEWANEERIRTGSTVAAAGIHLGLGTLLYQRNDLINAAPHIQRSVDLYELGELWRRVDAYRMQGYMKHAEGDFKTAYDLLGQACAIRDTLGVQQSNVPALPSLEQLGIMLSRVNSEMAHLLQDVSKRVENWGLHVEDKVDFSTPDDYPNEAEYSALARVSIVLNRATEALPLLDRLLDAARSMGRQGDEIRYLVLTALAHHSLEDTTSALNFLGRGLTLAEPQGYVRLFVDEGQPMAILLHCAISKGISPEYARKLLAAFPTDVLDSVQFEKELAVKPQTLVEPLSQRELVVLQLMAEGYKYKEIADRLIISINTVRHHNRNIFSKLNVHSRIQAIERARELNLL